MHPHLKQNPEEKRAVPCDLVYWRTCMWILAHRFLQSLISLSFSTASHTPTGKFRPHAPARCVLALFHCSLSCRLCFTSRRTFWGPFWYDYPFYSEEEKHFGLSGNLWQHCPWQSSYPPTLSKLSWCLPWRYVSCMLSWLILLLIFTPACLKSTEPVSPSFHLIVPFDNECGPSNCPQHLLFTNKEGVIGPVEVIPGAFDIFRDTSWLWVNPYLHSIALCHLSHVNFLICSDLLTMLVGSWSYVPLLMWLLSPSLKSVSRHSGIMSYGKIQLTVLYLWWSEPFKAAILSLWQPLVSIYAKPSWLYPMDMLGENFTFLGQLYSEGEMKGPYNYGCLLTLSGRRSGWSTAGVSSVSTFFHRHLTDTVFQMLWILLLLPEKYEGFWWFWNCKASKSWMVWWKNP